MFPVTSEPLKSRGLTFIVFSQPMWRVFVYCRRNLEFMRVNGIFLRICNCVFSRKNVLENVRVKIVEDARCRGINAISLEATRMGRPLYEKFGFAKMSDEMEYPC